MSYNTTRYLNFLTAVEALTPTQRATVDDANPILAFPNYTASASYFWLAGYEWVSAPSAAGVAYETAWYDLVGGGILDFLPSRPFGYVIDISGVRLPPTAVRIVDELMQKNGLRLLALGDPGRVRFAFERAARAALLKDFTDRAASATTVYAPVESLIPFASL